MRKSKSGRWLYGGALISVLSLFEFLKNWDSSRVTLHLAGTGIVLGIVPFMRWQRARTLQVFALCWLLMDLVGRNMFGPALPVRADAGAWRAVLAMAYAIIITLVIFYDHAMHLLAADWHHREPSA